MFNEKTHQSDSNQASAGAARRTRKPRNKNVFTFKVVNLKEAEVTRLRGKTKRARSSVGACNAEFAHVMALYEPSEVLFVLKQMPHLLNTVKANG